MSTLQVRNLPDDLHERLSERARREGASMSEYVTRLLRAELDRPHFDDWAASLAAPAAAPIDVLSALDGARVEYDPPAR